jgi:hypothetical protein
MSNARQNRLLALGIIVAVPLLIGFVTALVNSKSGEIVGALGSVIGGVIGAGGAALAVALTLLGERREERRRQEEREIQQINAVLAGVVFNIELLLHIVYDHTLPHFEQSHAAYKAFLDVQGDTDRAKRFLASLNGYPALNTRCPEIVFFECNFWEKLPFIVEQEPEVLKQSGWLVNLAAEMIDHIRQRNSNIYATITLMNQQEGSLGFYVVGTIVQRHASIANAECAASLQLFNKLIEMTESLQRLDERTKKVTLPTPLEGAIRRLKEIVPARAFTEKTTTHPAG